MTPSVHTIRRIPLRSGLILKLAWRNVWRNLRRTLITLSAVTFGLASIIMFNGFTDGFHAQWINNYVRVYTGHIQIHKKGYRDDPRLWRSIDDPEDIVREIEAMDEVEIVTTRTELEGLAATAENSAGVLIKGVEPDKETTITHLKDRIIEGRYLSRKKDILIGHRLKKKLSVERGDRIVLMSQAADGTLGAELFRLAGIFRMGALDFDSSVAVISEDDAREFAALDGKSTEIAVLLKRPETLDEVKSRLKQMLEPMGYEVFDWRELMPALTEMVELDNVFMYIILLIVIVVVAFGILNTMLMSIMERTREIGIMMALGTKPRLIVSLVVVEALFIGVTGIMAGLVLGVGANAAIAMRGIDLSRWAGAMEFFAAFNPVVYPETTVESLFWSSLTVFITAIISSIYPAFKASRLRPVEAIHFV